VPGEAHGHSSLSGALDGNGLAVCDGFLTPRQIDDLLACAHARRERGEFAAARIGAGAALRHRADLRGDSIRWFSEPLEAPERDLLAAFERLRLQLNRDAWLGLFELELHYACYPPGAGYARHVDQPQGRGERRVSAVLYLNRHWHPGDGGELRIFAADEGFRDIEPQAGRLVVFLTEGCEHAVLAARRERWSVTGWFRGREHHPAALR
jgi:SM-20-related protein